MKIKRFLAPDMRTALQHVRQEHGPDAVILSNRVTPEGVEIVAASQYDEELVLSALESSQATAPAAPAAASMAPDLEHADVLADALAAPLPGAAAPLQAARPAAMPAAMPAAPAAAPAALSSPLAEPTVDAVVTPTLADSKQAAAPAMPDMPAPTPAAIPAPTPVMAEMPATPVQPPAAPATLPAPPAPTPASDQTALSTQLRDGFAHLQQVIERGLERISDERLRSAPGHQQLLEWLESQGFAANMIRDLAEHIPADSNPHQIQTQVMSLLTERLPISPSNLIDEGGAIALIGPSGAGKTTIVGKLAAHYSVRHGVRDIALISLDHARPGGGDRLHSLARQLGIAVHEADSSQSLTTLLQWLQDYHLILIDTAGVSPHDPYAAEQLDWLRAADAVHPLLVLPANTHHADLDDVVRRFQPAQPQGVIVTKLDDTRRPGSVLSSVIEHQLPLSWVSDGQHLHDDLHRADASRLLLRLDAIPVPADAPYDPVASLVANHVFN